MADDAPRILANRYEVGDLIGRGGMAEVHIGHDTRLGRTVAIKILRSDLARDPSFQARFRREAQASASLNHPSIVAVYDTGEDLITDANGTVSHAPFIVMEYVEGHTVRDILRDGQAVPIEEAVEITAGVLSALGYSHHAGIVHRDIKPANVMLTPTGAVKVMDFGIARALADSAATMTQTQAVIGTAQYLSPEQARGEQVDARSDLYSTGCLLFELLTGRPPFTGDSPVAVAYQHVREPAPAPSSFASDVPETLDRITLKALAKERDSRYSTAAEFRADLEAAIRGGHVSAPAIGVLAAAAVVESAAAEATQILPPMTSQTQIVPTAGAWSPTAATPPGTHVANGDEEPPQRRWLLWTLIAIAIAAVAGIAFLLITNGDNKDPASDLITIPELTSATAESAIAQLTEAGLTPVRLTEPSDDIAADLVTRTDPAGGEEVAPASEVKVYVSTGPNQVAVPDVTGQTQDQARSAIVSAGLEVGNVQTENVPVDEGDVTKTDPPATTSVAKGSTVNIFVASGQVDVPDLAGMSRTDALAKLAELKLNSSTNPVEVAGTAPDTVLSQDRGPGLLQQGTTVTLDIAVAPTTVTVPTDLVGKPYAEAEAQLLGLGLVPARLEGGVSDKQAAGTVLSSNPNKGTTVQVGSTVTLTVASAAGAPNAAAPS
ncbi:Stk1 family PASTA domain-containing Ser/Thr kinase [Pengzhenrongella frigida]|uniref:non-specific serine/threonine protein kinase n=1 Tax=Pengzhenrongella frigida TaxID=1259133 RepID=A0A4V1ZHF2_9MICO|nr:Stk1 family PASTA domain-containing Ser/Thr kinase [Cellulomonas sp. HLT2-17]RYV51834.1 Stk1 family PASTA domain-containing Ser/Thr kinase [Cellulomonas sp. HLT2-17]